MEELKGLVRLMVVGVLHGGESAAVIAVVDYKDFYRKSGWAEECAQCCCSMNFITAKLWVHACWKDDLRQLRFLLTLGATLEVFLVQQQVWLNLKRLCGHNEQSQMQV